MYTEGETPQRTEGEASRGTTRTEFISKGMKLGLGATVLGGGMVESLIRSPSAHGAQTGTISIMNWVADSSSGKFLRALASEFVSTHPGTHIRLVTVPFATYLAAQTTRCRAKTLPDVTIQSTGTAHAPIFPCLVKVTKKSAGKRFTTLNGWVAAANGASYFGVPWGAQGGVMYGHTNSWRKAGLDPTKPPATWTEFLAACESLKKAGTAPLGISGLDSFIPWWCWIGMMPQLLPTAAGIQAFRAGTIKINDPAVSLPLKYLADTYDAGYWQPNFQEQRYTDVQAAFVQGNIGIVPGLFAGAVSWNVWDTAGMGPRDYFVFPYPRLPEAKVPKTAVFSAPSNILSISKNSKKKALAQEFIDFMTSQRGQQISLVTSGVFPNRTDVQVSSAGSRGATALGKILAAGYPINDVAGSYFKPAVKSTLFQKTTSAIVSHQLPPLLDQLTELQAQP